jgi:hypothetical protein
MATKQESFDFKSGYMVIVILSIFALTFTVQPGGVYASSNNDDDDDNNNENSDSDNDGNGGSDNDGNSGSDGESRQDLIDSVCEFARTNPELAEGAAMLLGFPGVGAAASVLCSLGN